MNEINYIIQEEGEEGQRVVHVNLIKFREFMVAYINEIRIYSQTWTDPIYHSEKVLLRIHEAGVMMKASKCQLGNSRFRP